MISEVYAAGFFDGEGFITITKTRRTPLSVQGRSASFLLLACVVNTDMAILEEYQARWGGTIIRTNYNGPAHRKPCWHWRVMSVSAVRFLRDIMPHLKQKLPQAELALRFQATITTERRRVSHDVVVTRTLLCAEMSRLKHVQAHAGAH